MNIYFQNEVFTEEEIEKIQKQSIRGVCGDFAAKTGIRGDETPQELLKRFCIPPLGGEGICDEFNKYGFTYTEICDGFQWKEDELKKLSEAEAWKMIALANIYWLKIEKERYKELRKKFSDS